MLFSGFLQENLAKSGWPNPLTLRIPTVISSFGTIKGTKSHHLRQHLILTNRVRHTVGPTWHEVVILKLVFCPVNSLIDLCLYENPCEQIGVFWLQPGGNWISLQGFYELHVMLWTSWMFKRFWIWRPWFGAAEEKVDMLVKPKKHQQNTLAITHPTCFTQKASKAFWKTLSHPVIFANLGKSTCESTVTKITPICVHGQHLDGQCEHISSIVSQWRLKN